MLPLQAKQVGSLAGELRSCVQMAKKFVSILKIKSKVYQKNNFCLFNVKAGPDLDRMEGR